MLAEHLLELQRAAEDEATATLVEWGSTSPEAAERMTELAQLHTEALGAARWLARYLAAQQPRPASPPPAVAGPRLSPDCRDGNHHKCYGSAWDDQEDRAVNCQCTCHLKETLNHA